MRTILSQVQSSILYIKGKIYEAMDNRAVATEYYKQALQRDVYSYEAFEALVQNQMLSAPEGILALILLLYFFQSIAICR